MNSVELPGMIDAVLLFLFLWIAVEQRKMRPDPGAEFDPSWGWSKKVRPLTSHAAGRHCLGPFHLCYSDRKARIQVGDSDSAQRVGGRTRTRVWLLGHSTKMTSETGLAPEHQDRSVYHLSFLGHAHTTLQGEPPPPN